MIGALIYLCLVGLVLWLVFFFVGKFVTGTPLQIIGIIIALIFLLVVLKTFGVVGPAVGPPVHYYIR